MCVSCCCCCCCCCCYYYYSYYNHYYNRLLCCVANFARRFKQLSNSACVFFLSSPFVPFLSVFLSFFLFPFNGIKDMILTRVETKYWYKITTSSVVSGQAELASFFGATLQTLLVHRPAGRRLACARRHALGLCRGRRLGLCRGRRLGCLGC